MNDLSELRIFGLALEIGKLVWNEISGWESFAKWTIGKQICDSADGISATMNEGHYRFSPDEQRKFFQHAPASAKETSQWSWISSEDRFNEGQRKLEDLIPQTVNYILNMQSKARP